MDNIFKNPQEFCNSNSFRWAIFLFCVISFLGLAVILVSLCSSSIVTCAVGGIILLIGLFLLVCAWVYSLIFY